MSYQVLDTQRCLGQSALDFRVEEVRSGKEGSSVGFECPIFAKSASP